MPGSKVPQRAAARWRLRLPEDALRHILRASALRLAASVTAVAGAVAVTFASNSHAGADVRGAILTAAFAGIIVTLTMRHRDIKSARVLTIRACGLPDHAWRTVDLRSPEAFDHWLSVARQQDNSDG